MLMNLDELPLLKQNMEETLEECKGDTSRSKGLHWELSELMKITKKIGELSIGKKIMKDLEEIEKLAT